MSILLTRSNDALKINPPAGLNFHLSVNGSDWLWAVTAIYSLSLLIVVGLAYFAKAGERIFHYLFTISLFTGAIAYFTAASDLGWTGVATTNNEAGIRQVFYVKYINWFLTWTPLITSLSLLSGVSWATIIYNVLLSSTMVISYLISSLIPTSYKWGFFAFGTFAYLLLSLSLLLPTLTKATTMTSYSSFSPKLRLHYRILSIYLVTLWTIYPIAIGVDDDGNVISVTSGWIIYGILDVLTVPVIGFAVLFLSRGWDYRELGIYFTQYGRVARAEGEFPEKMMAKPMDEGVAPEEPIMAGEQTV